MHSSKYIRWLMLQLVLLNCIISMESFKMTTINVDHNMHRIKTVATLHQFFQEYCNCEQNATNCSCCVKYQNDYFNVQQNLCSSLNIQRKTFEMGFNVALNGAVLFSNKFSANNIPPLCYPLMPPWPIVGCIKAHSWRQHEDNQFHACSNATLNVAGLDLLNFMIGCMDFGMRGVEWVDPEHDMVNNEPTPEISLETSDAVMECDSSTVQASSSSTTVPEND